MVRFEDGKLALHWDVLQDEATQAENREVDACWWPALANVEGNMRLKTAVRELIEQALTATLPEVLTLEPLKRVG